MVKDYCTLFPEYWRGIYIGECCKMHDSNCGTGTFYLCLATKLTKIEAFLITLGGGIGCWIKQPSRMWNKI